MTRKINFSAGPAALPISVLQECYSEWFNWRNLGASVNEISHRSDAFEELLHDLRNNLIKLFLIPNNYKVLLMHGGANAQFFSVPMNLLGTNKKADYLITGYWSRSAYKEACKYGNINIAAETIEQLPLTIPNKSEWHLSNDAAYLYYTSNETLSGLQFPNTPDINVPLVADMTSDFGTKTFTIEPHGIVFAGCQKNMGIAGLSIVIIRDDLLEQAQPITPTMFHYKTQAAKDSCYNTIPTFACYMTNKVCTWTIKQGGIAAMEENSITKATLLYDLIDSSNFYKNNTNPYYRSKTNICFNLPSVELTNKFLHEAANNNMMALAGHRAIGGVRASIYNAISIDEVKYLCDFMRNFMAKN